MKMIRKLLAVALLIGIPAMYAKGDNPVTSSDVDAWKGLRLSYDHIFMHIDEDEYLGLDGLNGGALGYVHAFQLTQKLPLFIEVGLGVNFAQGTYSRKDEMMDSKEQLKTLGVTIPVGLVYGVRLNNTAVLNPIQVFISGRI